MTHILVRRQWTRLPDTFDINLKTLKSWHFQPGNCLQLNDGRLGLIDYGQTRRIDNSQRIKFSHVVLALCDHGTNKNRPIVPLSASRCSNGGLSRFNVTRVASTMRDAGFLTRDNGDDAVMTQYARLLFDSDEESNSQGFSTPQVRP